MWLLPAFSTVCRVAMRTYYRLSVDGARVPSTGPVLLVANHPNSLLDPALVVAGAGRPVRFLAKAPLFTDPLVGWLVRGAGAIPVHRKQDDPEQMGRNVDAFAAAHGVLAAGAAVGIFPEGLSHDEPSIAPLRTGAARIALAAAAQYGGAFPIVPIGLTFRDKGVFRSDALVLVGEPLPWEDLAGVGDAPEAVRLLTARIDEALRAVTVNLERWADRPIIETADAIVATEFGLQHTAPARMARVRSGARSLAELRRADDPRWRAAAREILRHHRVLRRLGLTPAELHGDARLRDAALWAVRRVPLASVAALGGMVIGSALFWVPYRATAVAERRFRPDVNTRSTTKVLAGIAVFMVWIALLAMATGLTLGLLAGIVAAVVLPLAALATVRLHERWATTRREVRRFLLKRSRADLIAELRQRQTTLAHEIAALVETAADIPGSVAQ